MILISLHYLTSLKMHPLIVLIIRLISPFIWLMAVLICICFWIYRKGIHFVLKIKYGNRYGGLMDYSDGFTLSEDKTKWIICTVFINKCPRKIDVLAFLRDRFRKELDSHDYPKLTCTLHHYRGYAFWIKTKIDVDKCVKALNMPEQYDEDLLKATASRLYSSKLPYDDTLMWDMHVVDNPMIETTKEGTFYKYAALLRLHHVIGDGTATASLVSRIYERDTSLDADNLLVKKLQSMQEKQPTGFLKGLCISIWQNVSMVFFILFLMIQKTIELREDEESLLHGPELSGDKDCVWAQEKDVQFVPLTKKIKNTFKDVTFTDVALTAVTIGIARFLEKKNKPVPEEMPMIISVLFNYPTIVPNKPIPLQNKTTAGILLLPTGATSSLLNTLIKVRENRQKLTKLELWAVQFVTMYVYAFFPVSIRGIMHNSKSTGLVTVLPTGGRNRFLNDCYVESVLPLSPHVKKTGFSICVATYDDRYQFGVMVDRVLMKDQKDAQLIADEILASFQSLYDELKEKGFIE